jgi:hypothetical protein
MKLIAKFILFVFVTFLITPTIVTLIEQNTDISMFYSFAEEENHKDLKEIKADLRQTLDYQFLDTFGRQNSIIIFENLTRHDNIAEEIFIPPPDTI